MIHIGSTIYGWFMLAGICASLALWARVARRDERLLVIYVAALAGGFLGAKFVYWAAEGWLYWHDPNRWMILATGKSITGALLGGYGAVELAKHLLRYGGITGDWFAVITPLGVTLGRIGCLLQGCCAGSVCTPSWVTVTDAQGVARWPAAGMELVFNAIALAVLLALRARTLLPNQLFHLYLIGYGAFRFGHEFVRDTPRLAGPFSGYHVAALALIVLGVIRFAHRRGAAAHGKSELGLRNTGKNLECP